MNDPIPYPLDGRNAVVQKEHLSLTLQFSINRSANDPLIIGRYHCLYRQAIERRSLNGRHVFCADQRKVQRAWNRRGRKGQHIHRLKELFKFLLMQNSEPLFFIDYNEAEIFEHEIAGNEPMRADDDIDPALAE